MIEDIRVVNGVRTITYSYGAESCSVATEAEVFLAKKADGLRAIIDQMRMTERAYVDSLKREVADNVTLREEIAVLRKDIERMGKSRIESVELKMTDGTTVHLDSRCVSYVTR